MKGVKERWKEDKGREAGLHAVWKGRIAGIV